MRALTIVLLGAGLAAAQTAEQPAGLVVTPAGSQLLRSGTQLPLAAKAGDILFAGDSVRASGSAATVLHCGARSFLTLAPGSDAVMRATDVQVRTGSINNRAPSGPCYLPQVVRISTASQQQFGATLVRPLVVLAGTREQRVRSLAPEKRSQLENDLAGLKGDDPNTTIQRAGLFEQYGLKPDAAAEYRSALKQWPDAVWILSRLFALEDTPPEERKPVESKGRTYAFIVGISRYQSERIPGLLYAAEDARLIANFLQKERGGGLTDAELLVLTDQQATTSAIRLGFEEFLKVKTGKDDTAIFVIAAHGTVRPSDGQAFVITHDTDPEDFSSTALPLADLQKLFRQELKTSRRVMVFMDTCHAGKLGELNIRSINDSVDQMAEGSGEFFSFLAAGKDEKAEEGPQYGGGHGAFTYFVVDAWNGGSDRNQDGKVEFPEFVRYVRRMVEDATDGRQNPKDRGDLGRVVLAETARPGLQLARYQPGVQQVAMATPPSTRSFAASPNQQAYDDALAKGRILPDEAGSAFDSLRALQSELSPAAYLSQENRLRAALESAGQQVLLRYLAGDERPQQRDDFLRGAAYFEAAQRLTPESVFIEARKVFCQGRAEIFDRNYARAADLLERAARLDPAGAYSYNALGIAYLEQARYDVAARAFEDAIRFAPYWTYPVHNLALTMTQAGQYRRAIATYQQAMRLGPQYSYLPYNLGLVYQRMNRGRDAESSYLRAMSLKPTSPEPYNALGTLRAASGKREEAERFYRQALDRNARLLSARHNLGVLLAGDAARRAEAIDLLRENLRLASDHTASRLALARTYESAQRLDDAAGEYAALLKQQPEYAAGRTALARVYSKLNRVNDAVAELQQVVRLQPQDAGAWELLGDIHMQASKAPEARAAYEMALKFASDGDDRRRLKRKLR